MAKLGRRRLTLHLQSPLAEIPPSLADYPLELVENGTRLIYTFDAKAEATGIAALRRRLSEAGVDFEDLQTDQSSLEDIFVGLVGRRDERRAPQISSYAGWRKRIYGFEDDEQFSRMVPHRARQSLLSPVISTSHCIPAWCSAS